MATHLQSSSPNKRLKTLAPNPQSPPSSISKGKSKVEEQPIADNGSADCCGICLSEAGASRGYINCCNHYYCFVCIMEWAKVESKCPLCKRRFCTIRRPSKPPVFASERVVNVPVRDQVCHHYGNATIGPPDLYSEVKCSICQGIADESFLLLCDLCDSAAHTYCAGLGHTVPEGDWFCHDCALLRDEHLKSESHVHSDVQMSGSSAYTVSTNEHVSISDVVQESRGHAVRTTGSVSSDAYYFALSTSTDEVVRINDTQRLSSTSLQTIVHHSPKPNARTLRHCRNLHDRIRVLRKNWDGFRNGALRFSSPGEGNISQKSATVRRGEYLVSCSNQKPTTQSSSDVKNDTTRDHEVQKAWEMFDKAKSVIQNREQPDTVLLASKRLVRKLNPVRSENYESNGKVSLDSQQSRVRNVGSIGGVDHRYRPFEKYCYEQPSSSFGKGTSKLHVAKDVTSFCVGPIVGHSLAHGKLRSSEETTSHLLNADARSMKPQAKETLEGPHSVGSDASGRVVPNVDQVNHVSSSHSKVKHTKEKRKSEKINVDSQQYNDAKSEIQSLVKLNLKLQTKDEKLEVDAFKEVARLATHSILGACGLEQPRPGFSSIPGTKCSHLNDIRQQQKSSFMPCCIECFYVFVKDVVDSVLLLKKRS